MNRKKNRGTDQIVVVGIIAAMILMTVGIAFFIVDTVMTKNSKKTDDVVAETVVQEEIETEEVSGTVDIDLNQILEEEKRKKELEKKQQEELNNIEGTEEKKQEEETEEKEKKKEEKKEEEVTVESCLENMSIEQKVAQLFMVTPEALTGYDRVTKAGDATKESIKKYPVGGLILFEQNIVSKEQITEMTANLQKYSKKYMKIPMFIGIDEEGGSVARIASNSGFSVPVFSDMSEIGATGEESKAYDVGNAIGKYLKEYGFNVDFAPVADVLTNADNQVIGKRSFGSDAELVAKMDLQVLYGLKANDVYGCLKHFPGHGGVANDTHTESVYTSKTLEELQQQELVPFQKGIENGAKFIMASHISAPNVTGEDTPASLSSMMLTDILRSQMGYNGIIITDAMNMAAITSKYNSGEAAVKAIQAGADIILMPQDFSEAYHGVLDAITAGTLDEARIDESLKRILTLKIEELAKQ